MTDFWKKRRWRIVAFDHPMSEKSIVYRQDITTDQLLEAIQKAIEKGANLFSIRGF